jgi:cytochrome oxidase Cu insertion factor (SCO1/SenC/PrrC family)
MTRLEAQRITKGQVVPLFISIDPKRDTVEVVKEYVKGIC